MTGWPGSQNCAIFRVPELLQLQQVTDEWLGLALAYIMQKPKCSMPTAFCLMGKVLAERKDIVLAEKVRAVPLSQVLQLPPELVGGSGISRSDAARGSGGHPSKLLTTAYEGFGQHTSVWALWF